MTDCQLCGAKVADLANVCTRCTNALRRDLEDVPSLDHELDIALSKQTSLGGGGPTHIEMPANFDAEARGRKLKALLASWCTLIADTRGIPQPLDGLAPLSRWLLEHLEWLRHHPAGPDAVTEIRDAVRAVRHSIDRPTPRIYAGQCNECGTALYARQGATFAYCQVCVDAEGEHLHHDVEASKQAMLATLAVSMMAPPEAAFTLSILIHPIKPELIRTWAARGKLTPAGVDDKGHNIYRLDDIATLMRHKVAHATTG
ncbi:hypothetical protein [Nonomuraea endophytica]|uniref:hypothetical protein n=1 Tax=Nonomuraea endophytica TaxID=714136 RepID=UPI0037C5F4AE